MSTLNQKIYQGDSTDVVNIKIEGVTDYSLYSCNTVIVKNIGDTPIVDKTITPDAVEGFDVFITPVESALLSEGLYKIVCELTKTEATIVTYRKEVHGVITVEKAGI